MKRNVQAAHINDAGCRRMGLSHRLMVIILISGMLFGSACSGSNGETEKQGKNKEGKKGKGKDKQMLGNAFTGGTFEASGVAQVPGAGGVLIVDDSRPSEVLWMQIDQQGQQVGNLKPIPLGISVENPEGITYDGTYFYIVGAQANPKNGDRNTIGRFKFDPKTATAQDAGVIGDLRGWLLSKVPELAGAAAMKGKQGGLNIEGIAWDPERNRLLLGLRGPVVNDRALVVPLKFAPQGPFSLDNLQVEDGKVISLSLGGSAIRDIQYDTRLKSFLIISGAPETEEKGEFILWQWDGNAGSSPIQKSVLDKSAKPEGVTSVEVGGDSFIFIVCDASRYTRIDYSSIESSKEAN
jgi:hypothetical protein